MKLNVSVVLSAAKAPHQKHGHGARQQPAHGGCALHIEAQDYVGAAGQRVGYLQPKLCLLRCVGLVLISVTSDRL